MKTEILEVLGFNIEARNIPTTLAEAIQQAGSETEVLDNHIAYVSYHIHFGRLRKSIVEFIERKTGIKRQSHEEDGKTVIDEKDTKFVARVRLESDEATMTTIAAEMRTLWPEVDWAPRSRGQGRLAEKWLAKYDELVEAEKLEEFCAKHGIDATQPVEVLKPTVALKVKSLVAAYLEAAEASAMGV